MSELLWSQRMLATTRGRLVELLRRGSQTVDELATALGLTDNAIRAHLATLERDALVRMQGVRRDGGSGKPAYFYALTADAERLFPKAYGAVLNGVLAAVGERLTRDEVERLLREVGRSLAAEREAAAGGPARGGDLDARLGSAVEALNALGGLAEVERRDGVYAIQGFSCPLAQVAPEHPEVCQLAAALVEEIAGVPVVERCERGDVSRCRFVVAGDAGDAGDSMAAL